MTDNKFNDAAVVQIIKDKREIIRKRGQDFGWQDTVKEKTPKDKRPFKDNRKGNNITNNNSHHKSQFPSDSTKGYHEKREYRNKGGNEGRPYKEKSERRYNNRENKVNNTDSLVHEDHKEAPLTATEVTHQSEHKENHDQNNRNNNYRDNTNNRPGRDNRNKRDNRQKQGNLKVVEVDFSAQQTHDKPATIVSHDKPVEKTEVTAVPSKVLANLNEESNIITDKFDVDSVKSNKVAEQEHSRKKEAVEPRMTQKEWAA